MKNYFYWKKQIENYLQDFSCFNTENLELAKHLTTEIPQYLGDENTRKWNKEDTITKLCLKNNVQKHIYYEIYTLNSVKEIINYLDNKYGQDITQNQIQLYQQFKNKQFTKNQLFITI